MRGLGRARAGRAWRSRFTPLLLLVLIWAIARLMDPERSVAGTAARVPWFCLTGARVPGAPATLRRERLVLWTEADGVTRAAWQDDDAARARINALPPNLWSGIVHVWYAGPAEPPVTLLAPVERAERHIFRAYSFSASLAAPGPAERAAAFDFMNAQPRSAPLPAALRTVDLFMTVTLWNGVALNAAFIALVLALVAWVRPIHRVTVVHLRARAERRRVRGLCVHCGYDLGSESRVCPECGKDGRSLG